MNKEDLLRDYKFTNTRCNIVYTMSAYGGSFTKALAAAWFTADVVNQRKIFEAFPEYFIQYDEMLTAKMNRERSQNVTGNMSSDN